MGERIKPKRNKGRKRKIGLMRPVKIQISLCIRTFWSEYSLSALWIAKDAKFLHADIEDSEQTSWVRRLIWIFVACTYQKVLSHVAAHVYYAWSKCLNHEKKKKKKKKKSKKQEGHDGPISLTWIMLYIAFLTEMRF